MYLKEHENNYFQTKTYQLDVFGFYYVYDDMRSINGNGDICYKTQE